jgi:hypothetical protein
MKLAVALLVPLLFLGAGCGRDTSYIPAAPITPPDIQPTAEGGKAATGGESATVTPIIATSILVGTMPRTSASLSADEAQEMRTPVPLPDGTPTEYVSVFRTYHLQDKDINVTLTDTRGIPALDAYLDSYAERSDDSGYRRMTKIGELDGWITYSFGPNGDEDGTGSIVFQYRKRFLIQVDGSTGISAEALARFAEQFDLGALN